LKIKGTIIVTNFLKHKKMKTIFAKLLLFGIAVALFASCKKDDAIDTFQGGTAPVLTASVTGNIPLSYTTANNTALTLNWTNPNYMFTSGISWQNVTYLIEIDTTGSNFTNPNRQTVSVSPDSRITFTQSQFNDYLLNQLGLAAGVQHNLEIRVTSSINSVKATNLVSNVLKFTATPYAIPPKVQPPTSGQLYLIGGDPKLNSWGNPVPTPGLEFTQVTPTLYTITVQMSGGDNTSPNNQFLFIPVNGSWSHKYATNSSLNPTETGGGFGYDLSDNFPGPSQPGTYTITVDFQKGKYTVVKQ
jgi:hypothetical protein